MKRDISVYLLVRTDMPSMGGGKGMAQSHHAGFQLAAKYIKHPLVKAYITDGLRDGADHFGTTLTMAATKNEIDMIFKSCTQIFNEKECIAHLVTDPSYPFIVDAELANLIVQNGQAKIQQVLSDGKVVMVRSEITCAYFMGDRKNPLFKDMFSKLSMYSNKLVV